MNKSHIILKKVRSKTL